MQIDGGGKTQAWVTFLPIVIYSKSGTKSPMPSEEKSYQSSAWG